VFKNLPPHARPKLDLPRETRATCSTCVMAKSDWPREARDPGPFAPSLKCCTFEPFIPNFSLGRILSANPGIALDGQLTPLGLIPRRSEAGDFGREAESRCAFLTDGATCSIWQNRPSVCRSYYCVSDLGEKGQGLWREAERLGNEAEWTLAHELLWSLGFTQDEIDQRTWAEWRGRERELYLETARRAFGESYNSPDSV